MHCLGLLRAGAPGASEAEAARRAYILTRCSAASRLLFLETSRRLPGRADMRQRGFVPETDLHRWADAQLHGLFLQLWELAQAAHPLGNLLFARLPPGEEHDRELARCAALALELRAELDAAAAAAEAQRRGGGRDAGSDSEDGGGEANELGAARAAASPADKLRIFSPRALALPPDEPPLQASVCSLRVSRVGQFSCPLQCGAVLLGDAPRAGDGTARSRRAALASCVDESRMLRALHDATDLQAVHDACAAGFLSRIVHVGSSAAGTWAEFEPRGRAAAPAAPPGALWPVVWFAFTPRAEATERAQKELEAYGATMMQALNDNDIEPTIEPGGASGWDAFRPVGGFQMPVLADEDGFDLLDIPLSARHGGSLACVKLIASENLMDQWGDDHAEPNIDVTALEMHGVLAPQLPPPDDACS